MVILCLFCFALRCYYRQFYSFRNSLSRNYTAGFCRRALHCIHSHTSPREWFSTLQDPRSVEEPYPPSRYELLPGSCDGYCVRFCTNATTYNSDHCAMNQYGDHTECCHKSDSRPGLKFNDPCSPKDYCCPPDLACVRDGLFVIHGVCGKPCDSNCDYTEGCSCKGWKCEVGNEGESGNGWCVPDTDQAD
jgi:hypothetical protein